MTTPNAQLADLFERLAKLGVLASTMCNEMAAELRAESVAGPSVVGMLFRAHLDLPPPTSTARAAVDVVMQRWHERTRTLEREARAIFDEIDRLREQ